MPPLLPQTGRLALYFGTVPCPPSSAPAHPPLPPRAHAPSDVQEVYAAGGSEGADLHLSLRSLRHVKVMGRGSFGKVIHILQQTRGHTYRGSDDNPSAVMWECECVRLEV